MALCLSRIPRVSFGGVPAGKVGSLLPPASAPASARRRSSLPGLHGQMNFARTSELALVNQAQAATAKGLPLPLPFLCPPRPIPFLILLHLCLPRFLPVSHSRALGPQYCSIPVIRLQSAKLENLDRASNLGFMLLFFQILMATFV